MRMKSNKLGLSWLSPARRAGKTSVECSYDLFLCHATHVLPQYFTQNSNLSDILNNEDHIVQMILDPVSAKLPATLKNNWVSVKTAYSLSRQFCYSIHRKREKLYKEVDK